MLRVLLMLRMWQQNENENQAKKNRKNGNGNDKLRQEVCRMCSNSTLNSAE